MGMDSPQYDTVNMATEPEKEGEFTMPLDFNQESYWESAAFYQQSLVSTPVDNTFYELGPLGIPVNSSSPQYTRGLTGEPIGISYSEWGGSMQGDLLSGGEFSPGSSRSDKAIIYPESRTRSTTAPKRPSAEAIARRRKQNRVSQAAWRARNKELVEELRKEIAEHCEYNQMMQEAMRSLLKTTEALKGAIEGALALPTPKESQDGSKGEGQILTPESSAEGVVFDLDAPHD